MSYYLRVEGINIGNFVFDTNDLSTIRGGGLILLNALNDVERLVKEEHPELPVVSPEDRLVQLNEQIEQKKQLIEQTKKGNLTKKQKKGRIANLNKTIKQIENEKKNSAGATNPKPIVPTITKGASWGLFELVCSKEQAKSIARKVRSTLNADNCKYASFVVSLLNASDHKSHYQSDRDKIQTLNRWQQLVAPTISFPEQGNEVCFFDKVSPAKEGGESSCESVRARRQYGREKKHDLYKDLTGLDLKFTNDFSQISKAPDRGVLNGKIGFLYIDGNAFGSKQKATKSPEEQKRFDIDTRTGRERVLKEILTDIKDQDAWLFSDADSGDSLIRMETLLWGGDEIIWVVPAWQGWWLTNRFYELAMAENGIKHGTQKLYHGAGLVFCHHNAPIHKIEELARALADGFAKKKAFKSHNKVAYEVLESFDHAGANLSAHRELQTRNMGQVDDMLISAEQIQTIMKITTRLKNNDFPHKKIYQIISARREGDNASANKLETKLRDSIGTQNCNDLDELSASLSNSSGSYTWWYHLANFWDYS